MEHFYDKIGGWFNFANIYWGAVNRCPSGSHFVEVGSWLGKSASYMAVEIINSKKEIAFDCVDVWKYWDGQDELRQGEEEFGNLYLNFLENTKPVKHIVNPIQLLSAEAAGLYKDESLDFIFIDAAHDYENVKKDISAWYPKLKKDGVIAGHDFTTAPGVKKAVREFFGDKARKTHKRCRCWLVAEEKEWWLPRD